MVFQVVNVMKTNKIKLFQRLSAGVFATCLVSGIMPAAHADDHWIVYLPLSSTSVTSSETGDSATSSMYSLGSPAIPDGSPNEGTTIVGATANGSALGFASTNGSGSTSIGVGSGGVSQVSVQWSNINAGTITSGVTVTFAHTWMAGASAAANFTYDNFQQKFLNEGSASASVTAAGNGGALWPVPSGNGLGASLKADSPVPDPFGQAVANLDDGNGRTGYAVHERSGSITVRNGTSWGSNADLVMGRATWTSTVPRSWFTQNTQTGTLFFDNAGVGFTLNSSASGGGASATACEADVIATSLAP